MKIRSFISIFILAIAILTIQARAAYGFVDVGVSAIIQPTCSDVAGSLQQVTVVITNFGTTPISNLPVIYKLNDGPPVAQTYSQLLAPSASDTFELSYIITVPSWPFTFCSYTVLVGDSNPANDTTCILCNGIPMSINEHDNISNNKIIVYPNPSSGKFSLKVDNKLLNNSSIIITDILGKVVWTYDFIKPEFNFDLTNEPNGLYLIKLKTPSGSSNSKLTLAK
jgi:hypothetical protein